MMSPQCTTWPVMHIGQGHWYQPFACCSALSTPKGLRETACSNVPCTAIMPTWKDGRMDPERPPGYGTRGARPYPHGDGWHKKIRLPKRIAEMTTHQSPTLCWIYIPKTRTLWRNTLLYMLMRQACVTIVATADCCSKLLNSLDTKKIPSPGPGYRLKLCSILIGWANWPN